ncbi:MAG: SDR family NAD(P)-dependent oxidoreductase [candidate division Zixibacteria bacterium]|nr:SDR family NAD(P)-dependent oxidoreductase [candidate division Zixibacteria bacterium]
MKLKDKITIITGGTGAIGRVIAQTFLSEGAKVIVTFRREEEFSNVLSKLSEFKENLSGKKVDVTIAEQVKKFMEETAQRFGRIDILVNGVGGFAPSALRVVMPLSTHIVDLDEKTWDFLFNLNLKSAFLCSKYVLPYMLKQNYGKIVNISAKLALEPVTGTGPYSASKSALITLTETLAKEVKDSGINANAVALSLVKTEANLKTITKPDPSKWVEPEDVANTILFLCSDEAKSINGDVIKVYGKLI